MCASPRRSLIVAWAAHVGIVSTVFLTGTTALLAWVVRRDLWPSLRGPAPFPIEWRWEWEPLGLHRVVPACVVAAGLVAIAAVPLSSLAQRAPRRVAGLMLCAVTVLGMAFEIGMAHLRHDGAAVTLVGRTLQSDFNSYFSVADATRDTPISALLAAYDTQLPTLPLHARTHPPGPVLYYRGPIVIMNRWPHVALWLASALKTHGPWRRRIPAQASDASIAAAAVGAFGLVVLAALTCWPVAGIAEVAGVTPLTAAQIGALWVVTPAPMLFVPWFDQALTCLVAFAGWFALRALKAANSRRAVLWSLGCGAAAGTATFSSFGAAPMIVTVWLIAIAAAAGDRVTWARIGLPTSAALVAFAAWWVGPILYGYHPLDVMMTGLRLHREDWTMTRTRELWWRYNLLDFGMFAGWPLIATLALRAGQIPRAMVSTRLMLVAGAGALFVLDAADVTRGEVGRLWMPLLALLLPLAVAAITPVPIPGSDARRGDDVRLVVLVALQAAICLTIRLSWDV